MASPQANIPIAGVPDFWDRVAASECAVLLLDYDGTLAPFHPDRMQARPLEGISDQFDLLAALPGTTVALVSGRPVDEILTLTGASNLLIAGTHGFELYRPGRGISTVELSEEVFKRLDEAHQQAARLVGERSAERKVATVALHVRGLDPVSASQAERSFRDSVAPLLDGDLELRDFNGGVELRVRGRDKGDAITEILAELPPADLVVYVGDDQTDEDAFRALPVQGIGVKVGSPDQPTAAQGRLESCEDVLQFLRNWIAMKQ